MANAGDGRTVQIRMAARMLEGQNTTVFQFSRPTAEAAAGRQLPSHADVRLTVRVDIEDRNFHWETKRNGGADFHFSSHVRLLDSRPPDQPNPNSSGPVGFVFSPAVDRQLRVFADSGRYHAQPEWSENIPHPVEQSRGQPGAGDAFSQGWFDVPLPKGAAANLIVTAERTDPDKAELAPPTFQHEAPPSDSAAPESQLRDAIKAFVVRRGSGKTVIAGYPWFLDWGRDSFICARGLLAAGMVDEVKQLLVTFARFEKDGTLPNTIFGEDASNRDTSDAPLWFGVVCEELAALQGPVEGIPLEGGRTIGAVLESIGVNYARGTPNGIHMDPDSALIWSPSHFTWMDTNYPACTPREGYPVEIQALWLRLLRQLARIGSPDKRDHWRSLAEQALASIKNLFWLDSPGYFADVLLSPAQQ
ncbi:MAG: amylo-alpha-1,6-glucosidase, partial [Limisphaerales bacterium]